MFVTSSLTVPGLRAVEAAFLLRWISGKIFLRLILRSACMEYMGGGWGCFKLREMCAMSAHYDHNSTYNP